MPSLPHHSSASHPPALSDAQPSASSHALALVIAGSAVALALAGWFVLRPAFASFRAASAISVEELQDRLAQRQASLEKVMAIEEQFASITAEERAKLATALPEDAGVSDLIATMEAMVRLSDMKLVSVGVDESAPAPVAGGGGALGSFTPPGVRIVPLRVQVEGSNYLTLQKLLRRIETNVRVMDIPALAFNAQEDGLTLSLVAYAYRLPQLAQ